MSDKVPDLPCPKCGHEDVRMSFEDEAEQFSSWHDHCRGVVPMKYSARYERDLFVEHFHRHCQRCRYWWPTTDALES